MTLEQFATFTTILASLAVIVSLIFVGIQLRQNSVATRMMTAQLNTQIMIENFGRLIDHPDIAEIFATSPPSDTVSPGDRLRIGNIFAATFRHMEMLHMHQRYGIHEKEMWQASEARLKERIALPIIRAWWETSKHSYSPSFVTYVDTQIGEWLHNNPPGTKEADIIWGL